VYIFLFLFFTFLDIKYITGACGLELPPLPLFQLLVCIFISSIKHMSSLFSLFNVFASISVQSGALRLSAFSILGVLRLSANLSYVWAHFTCGMCDVDNIFIDGTFKCCPKHFHQLYSIHDYKNGNYVPLLFVLLPQEPTCKILVLLL
jgi:hypothetical protein